MVHGAVSAYVRAMRCPVLTSRVGPGQRCEAASRYGPLLRSEINCKTTQHRYSLDQECIDFCLISGAVCAVLDPQCGTAEACAVRCCSTTSKTCGTGLRY
eukprot:2262315-Rhodomonas_salina.1